MKHSHEAFKKEKARLEKEATKKYANRLASVGGGGEEGEASWGDCDSRLLQSVVAAITGLGGAVTLGLSRDKGAKFLTLLLDESKKPCWIQPGDDTDDKLKLLLGDLEALNDTP